jgi:hypothetical protein
VRRSRAGARAATFSASALVALVSMAGEAVAAQPARDAARGTDDRGEVEPEDVALFLPRAAFFLPARVTQLVALPIRAGLGFVEAHHVIEHVEDFFYNDARTAAVVPTLSLGSGLGLQVGARAFHEALGSAAERGEVAATWGLHEEHVYRLSFEAPRIDDTPLWVETKTTFETHPRLRFFGIGDDGPRALAGSDLDPRAAGVESFYRHQRLRQVSTLGIALGRPGLELRPGVRGRFARHDFDRGDGLADGDRSLEDVYDTALVTGYEFGATLAEVEGIAVFDARDAKGATANGFYAEAFGGGALPFGDVRFAHFGAELTGYVDLYRGDRVLVLRAALDAVEGSADRVPFFALPDLGGAHRLRGYPLGRFRDEKALFGTVEYHYPIHELLAGSVYVDVGEVAADFAGLVRDPELHVGGGAGLVMRSKSRVIVTLDVAGGDGVQVYLTTDPLRAFADRDDEL